MKAEKLSFCNAVSPWVVSIVDSLNTKSLVNLRSLLLVCNKSVSALLILLVPGEREFNRQNIVCQQLVACICKKTIHNVFVVDFRA
jgi:hypothetical protein